MVRIEGVLSGSQVITNDGATVRANGANARHAFKARPSPRNPS